MMSLSKPVCCKEHPKATIIEEYRAGDQICSECGLVVGDRVIDTSSEWTNYNNNNRANPSRVGSAENQLLDSGGDLSTLIAGGHGSAAFDEHGAPKYTVQRVATTGMERALRAGHAAIDEMAGRLGLPKTVVDQAAKVLKDFLASRAAAASEPSTSSKKRSETKRNDSTPAAALYVATRLQQLPRTFKEICSVTKSGKKEVSQAYKLILKELGTVFESTTPDEFIGRFCTNLRVGKQVGTAAMVIAKRAVNLDLVAGRSPVSVAAAAIYMAAQASAVQDKRTLKEISQVAGVADVTIRQAYKLMYPKAETLFPSTGFVYGTPVDQLPLS